MGKAYLILENGAVFEGQTFGYDGEAVGELVFNTGMTGYLETLTDPSYYGQIVIQTFPLVGNYGVIPSDFESGGVQVKGYIVREWCQEPSNFRCEGELDTFLRENKIPGLYGLDTRELTRIVRESGVMNCRISKKPELTEDEWHEVKSYVIRESVENTSTRTAYTLKADEPKYNVALWDFGAKGNIARELVGRGCNVTVMPWSATAEEIAALRPDGIMLTNGPGDPRDNKQIISELGKLCTYNIPIFGICLGHQLLALSQGAEIIKLHYGHRGANQPVLETATGRVFVTSQNHGYAVVSDTLPETADASYLNCNDLTCEGANYKNMPVFSVQFHPEACGGPLDSKWLFDKFIDKMEESKKE